MQAEPNTECRPVAHADTCGPAVQLDPSPDMQPSPVALNTIHFLGLGRGTWHQEASGQHRQGPEGGTAAPLGVQACSTCNALAPGSTPCRPLPAHSSGQCCKGRVAMTLPCCRCIALGPGSAPCGPLPAHTAAVSAKEEGCSSGFPAAAALLWPKAVLPVDHILHRWCRWAELLLMCRE